MATIGAVFALALGLGLVLTPAVRRLAVARGWVARPRADRWSQRPTALMGGIAIFVAVSCGLLPAWPQLRAEHQALLAAAAAMFVVGLVDDRLHLKPHTKLLAQLVAAILLVAGGMRFGLSYQHSGLHFVDEVWTVIFLVGVANAFNLLDNMDGLCAGVAAIAAGCLVALQAGAHQYASAACSAALCGACLGFLRFNFSPATIFMGDCGSLFIGLFLGAASLLENAPAHGQNVVSVLFLPVLVLMIPLMDTCLVTVARKCARRPVSQGGCDHSSHRLVAIGLSEKRAVLFLYSLALAGGAVALAIRWLDWYLGHLLLPLFVLGIGAVAMYLGQVRVYEEADNLGDLLDRTPLPLLAQHRYRRRMVEVVIDTVAVSVGFYLANLLRYESGMGSPHVQALFRQMLPTVIVTHLLSYFTVGVYRGIWRHTSVGDLPRFIKAVSLAMFVTWAVLAARGRLQGVSETLLAINWMVQLSLLGGSRVGVKLLRDTLVAHTDHERRPVLLIGAGEEAELALRQIRLNPGWGMMAAGIVCEERQAVGLRIHGTPVVGTSEHIRDILRRMAVSEAVLVDPAYGAEEWQHIQRVCQEMGVPTRAVKTELLPCSELA